MKLDDNADFVLEAPSMFLSGRIRKFATPDKKYGIHIGYRASDYAKDDKVAGIVANHQIAKELSLCPIDTVKYKNSKESHGFQVADVLLGAMWSGRRMRASVATRPPYGMLYAVILVGTRVPRQLYLHGATIL